MSVSKVSIGDKVRILTKYIGGSRAMIGDEGRVVRLCRKELPNWCIAEIFDREERKFVEQVLSPEDYEVIN